jgi:hypothetical protein
MNHFDSIRILPILVAALSGFVIGGLWYGPLFQKPWMQLTGMTKEKGAKVSPVFTFGLAYVLNVIGAFGLTFLIGTQQGWQLGLHAGLAAGFFFAATAIGVIYLFEQQPVKLFFINAAYQIVNFGAMGAILGLWR